MKTNLRVLMVEDSPDDAELVRIELESAGFKLNVRRIDTEPDMRDALSAGDWDLIISDFQMPQFNGLRAFAVYQEFARDIPFIFVSGALGEERAVEAMRAGARDYLLKDNLTRLGVAVRRELTEAANRRRQREMESLAEREKRRFAAAVEASGAGVFEFRVPSNKAPYFSPRWTEILGYTPDELAGATEVLAWLDAITHPDDLSTPSALQQRFPATVTARWESERRLRHKAGAWIDVSIQLTAFAADGPDDPLRVVGVLLDLTEKRRLETQLRQAQKMEAVGRLAGGIAHDFNNLLTGILGFGSFVLKALPPDGPSHEDMEELLKAARKAESLTSQLLAFSRQQKVNPRVLNVNELVADVDRMLRRVLGEDIDFRTVLAADIWNVRIDPSAFDQVLVNLAVNARDAMPRGGRLTVETANVTINGEQAVRRGHRVPPGDYVVIAVSDTGTGMDEATQERIFEPFFTTKEAGKGTGLGLSTCYGIIKQADGYIWVYSEVGRGTTFKIYLPRVTVAQDTVLAERNVTSLQGTETILLAEDDVQVRKLAMRVLRSAGYRVIEAESGEQALARQAETAGPIDLLLTDVVMSGMTGPELAERVLAARPGIRVLFMSGYTANAFAHAGTLPEQTLFVQKPFTPDSLLHDVRAVLESEPES